jgi:hypothetical protein
VVGEDAHPALLALDRAIAPFAASQYAQGAVRRGLPFFERLPEGRHVDAEYLQRPRLYSAWYALGRPAWVERLLIRWFGPMSRAQPQGEVFGLRGPRDERPAGGGLLGCGWHYRYPGDGHRWANIPDARLVFPSVGEAVRGVTIEFAPEAWAATQGSGVRVFANGRALGTVTQDTPTASFELPPSVRRSAVIEVSLRRAGLKRFVDPGIHAKWYRMLTPVVAVRLAADA